MKAAATEVVARRPAFLELPGRWPFVRHALTTRILGNLSVSRPEAGDPLPARHRLAAHLGLSLDDFAIAALVHGSEVLRLSAADRGRGAHGPDVLGPADAVFTTEPGLGMLVTSADCPPVLVSGPGVAGLAHAGWRGALAGVLPALISAAARAAALPRAALAVGIGPGLCPNHGEIGSEVAKRFVAAGYGAHLLGSPSAHKVFLDLPGLLAAQAEAAGVGRIVRVGWCTYCARELFYSHRRDGEPTGRFGLAAALPASSA